MLTKKNKLGLENLVNRFKTWAFAGFFAFTTSASALTHYVAESGNSQKPYTSWQTAARTIQLAVDAVDYFATADEIIVTNGTYFLTKEINLNNLGNRLAKIRSVNGPEATILDGKNQTRIFNLAFSNTTIEGFTLRNGKIGANDLPGSRGTDGGAASLRYSPNATLRNCIIRENSASGFGGGVCLYNGGKVENCTITGNRAVWGHAGVYIDSQGTLKNTILYFNNPDNFLFQDGTYDYCCAPMKFPGTGNITNNPEFVDFANKNFRLKINSKCIDSGTNLATLVKDADNIPRPLDGNNDRIPICDIGAYEFLDPYLRISGIERQRNSFSIYFNSLENLSYGLQSSSSLQNQNQTPGSWKNETNEVAGTGDPVYIRIANPDSKKYYRVRINLN